MNDGLAGEADRDLGGTDRFPVRRSSVGTPGGHGPGTVPALSLHGLVPIDSSADRAPGRLRRRLRNAGLTILLVLAILALALALALAVVRRELKARVDRDSRPCPACRSPAIHDGHALLDEQGHRLLFATPEQAAAYAADYAKP